jgi:hypothetical protein
VWGLKLREIVAELLSCSLDLGVSCVENTNPPNVRKKSANYSHLRLQTRYGFRHTHNRSDRCFKLVINFLYILYTHLQYLFIGGREKEYYYYLFL